MTALLKANIPAVDTLAKENIKVIVNQQHNIAQGGLLKIAIVNLMPIKTVTETQLLRLIGITDYDIQVDLIHMQSHVSKNTPLLHIQEAYKSFVDIEGEYYDGMIVTGAPVELLHFTKVDYWPELVQIFEWSKTNVRSTLYICWAAQAALYHFHGIDKYELDNKISGIYEHSLANDSNLFLGHEQGFLAPHSRYTYIKKQDIQQCDELVLLAESEEAGVYAVESKDKSRVYITGHPEYDVDTLKSEYLRDLDKGLSPSLPKHYYPSDDSSKEPVFTWGAHASLMYSNWLDYYVNPNTKPTPQKKLTAALLGYGVVGSSVYKSVQNREDIDIKYVFEHKAIEELGSKLTFDFDVIINDPQVSTVIELIGGVGVAYELVKKALLSGKNVVTANKKLMAAHYKQLHDIAKEKGVQLRYTAAVGGGIPWLVNLKRAADISNIVKISGIMNGTTNYILSSMHKNKEDFSKALSKAQQKGYAEADPTADIYGYDAREKCVLSANAAFGLKLNVEDVPVIGINNVSIEDIIYAEKNAYVLKLMCYAVRNKNSLNAWVEPSLIPVNLAEANVHENNNLISYYSELGGKNSFLGQGAGGYPTAANVIQDCVDIFRDENSTSTKQDDKQEKEAAVIVNDVKARYYVRYKQDEFLDSIAEIKGDGFYITKAISVSDLHTWYEKNKREDIFAASIKTDKDI